MLEYIEETCNSALIIWLDDIQLFKHLIFADSGMVIIQLCDLSCYLNRRVKALIELFVPNQGLVSFSDCFPW